MIATIALYLKKKKILSPLTFMSHQIPSIIIFKKINENDFLNKIECRIYNLMWVFLKISCVK